MLLKIVSGILRLSKLFSMDLSLKNPSYSIVSIKGREIYLYRKKKLEFYTQLRTSNFTKY